LAAAVVGAIFATALAAHAIPSAKSTRDRYIGLDTFAQALSYIVSGYVDEVDERKLMYGAVDGMLQTLDPYSKFLPPESYQRLREDTEGEFGGVGITLGEGLDNAPIRYPLVERVVPASPAARAGIRVGDAVVAISGKPTATTKGPSGEPRSLHSALRGREGSRVKVSILRAAWKEAQDRTLVREQIKTPTVQSFTFAPGIGYISISRFQEATVADVTSALHQIKKSGKGTIGGLVLDLRGNPGGLLDQAVVVADAFLDKGLIVTVAGRSRGGYEQEVAHKKGTWSGFPIVVVVDSATASAAEIVAGALKDHGRGTILGLKTFGKGSVQTFLDLADGSGLKLTTSRYYTPSGQSLQGVGIIPDIPVEAFTPEVIVAGGKSPSTPGTEPQSGEPPQKGAKLTKALRRRLRDDYQLSVAYDEIRSIARKGKTD
jgi:carboxyl-terminal processing protease